MTVTTTTSETVLTANGVTTIFPFNFKLTDATHLVVERRTTSTGLVNKVYSASEYTLNGLGDAAGGSVTFAVAPPIDNEIVLRRVVPYRQELDIVNQGGFYPDTLEEQLDEMVMQIQQISSRVSRSLAAAPGDSLSELASAAARAGKFLVFDSSGNPALTDGTVSVPAIASNITFSQTGVGALERDLEAEARETVKITQFDGANDSAKLAAALAAHPGRTIEFPYNSSGYSLTSTVTVPEGTRLVFDKRQSIYKEHDGVGFDLGQYASVEGGRFRGGAAAARPGYLFKFSGVNGGQVLSNFTAEDNLSDPILYYENGAGGRSIVRDATMSRHGAVSGDGNYAVVMADAGSVGAAVPRQFSNINFNGTPSFDFGSCNNVQITNCYCADLKFSDRSRAVRMSSSRVGNQATLTVKGANHSLFADWSPVVTIGAGTDANEIGGSFNTGMPLDLSGNGRNLLNYAEIAFTPKIFNDSTELVPGGAFGTISRIGRTYSLHVRFLTPPLGLGFTGIQLPVGARTSSPVEFFVFGLALYNDGTDKQATIIGRVLPVGNDKIILYRDDAARTPFNASSPASSTINELHFFIQYGA